MHTVGAPGDLVDTTDVSVERGYESARTPAPQLDLLVEGCGSQKPTIGRVREVIDDVLMACASIKIIKVAYKLRYLIIAYLSFLRRPLCRAAVATGR